MDTSYDSPVSETVGFYGPFATIAIELGGLGNFPIFYRRRRRDPAPLYLFGKLLAGRAFLPFEALIGVDRTDAHHLGHSRPSPKFVEHFWQAYRLPAASHALAKGIELLLLKKFF